MGGGGEKEAESEEWSEEAEEMRWGGLESLERQQEEGIIGVYDTWLRCHPPTIQYLRGLLSNF